ncbi:hypothetical protein JRI60_31470 [Archangium violaceum]|uniref:hypothetical protein n=1 Tax=Archangium violaceum TaxID=83451 RepID=UPI00194ED95C|nr:hypothetical protein [Archangium violaceum]QRN93681.1 hypothetical protein JRI60_31470 [Archangium violaceum]
MTQWHPKKSIDEKKKTGDAEQLQILWAVYESVVKSPADPALRPSLEELSTDLTKFADRTTMSARTSAMVGDYKALKNARKMLEQISSALNGGYHQFLVNLACFNFRTAMGGRARKATSVLRKGSDDHYSRPFEDEVPLYVSFLLANVPNVSSTSSTQPETLTLEPQGGYILPTRFTATFPLSLRGSEGSPMIMRNPRVPNRGLSAPTIKYAFMGSFGFSEPGYCTWDESPGVHESAGTRLSLGAYSLDPQYLTHVLSLVRGLNPEAKELYRQYGSVGERHLRALLGKFGGNAGPRLAIAWINQMADVASALIQRASYGHTESQPSPLEEFFKKIQEKIDGRRKKLAQIQANLVEKEGIGAASKTTLFEYLWVFESTLWEFAFLGASCLSMDTIARTLQGVFSDWTPTVGLSEDNLVETLSVNGTRFQRLYFPSGTAAANTVYDALWALGFGPFTLKVDPKKLSTFTPYFEFYQNTTSILHPTEVGIKARSRNPKCEAAQVWLNLSDGLHSELLDERRARHDVAEVIAQMASQYVQELYNQKLHCCVTDGQGLTINYEKVCLVIDYTKFAGDMPNGRLYPILEKLRDLLLDLRKKEPEVVDVVFLRSNLKYNTGSLDRYQSGEILVGPGSHGQGLSKSLSNLAPDSFSSDSEWSLRGDYIPLMKKMYLLSDAVGFGRWREYSKLWPGGVFRPRPLDVKLAASRVEIVILVDYTLSPIFTHLIRELSDGKYQKDLPEKVKSAIRDYWKRIVQDKVALEEHYDVESKVLEVTGYLERELSQIIDMLTDAVQRIPKSYVGTSRQPLGQYVQRMVSAREKMASLQVGEDSGLADTRCCRCKKARGGVSSREAKWHVCTKCGANFCPTCGSMLPLRRFQSQVARACSSSSCKGPTRFA